jgi:cysteine-S-conjugate beta-lyase
VTDPLHVLTLDELRQRSSAKWRTYPQDVLPLWVAEMDVPLAEPIAEVLTRAVAIGDTGYSSGVDEYADALAGFAQRRWGWAVDDPARMRLVPDVMAGVVELLGLVTAPGDAVVVNPPVYPPFFEFIRHAGRRVVEAPLAEDGRLDLAALDDACAAARAEGAAAAYLLCSPHNPTGAVHTAAELTSVAQVTARHGVRVIADEIHAPVVPEPATFVPYLSVPGTADAYSVISASKGWNLAGVKAGLAIAGVEAADELAGLPEIVGHGVSHLGVLAHTAAFRDADDWLDALLGAVSANRSLLLELLDDALPEVDYRPGEGTYLAWLDLRGLGLGDSPAETLRERGQVALLDGVPFGTGGRGHARLNLAASTAVLTEAVQRMTAAVR